MASIRKEFFIQAAPAHVWAALRDVGNIHKNLAPGFLTDCRLEGDARIVKFANGMEARELILDVDDKTMRVAWSARGTRLTHHSASLQVFPDGERTRAVWIADLLPHEAAPMVAAMIEQGGEAMTRHLEAKPRPAVA